MEDLYYPHPLVQDILWVSLHKAVEPILMHWPCNKLREKALKTAMEHIHYEDENTRYICIGPVNKFLEGCPGDLSFWYHHISKGAWPFSTADRGWPISDCTAEGLKASHLLSLISSTIVGDPMATNRLYDAVNVLLSLMNPGGGFATYELTRSYAWLEIINPAETFGDIIIDYLYVECTSESIQALTSFRKLYPGHRRDEIENCITKAVRFIEKIQESDGSWYGSWAVASHMPHGLG